MTLEDIIRALNGGDPEAAAYLNDPSSNPAVDRVQPYPSGIPMPNTTLGPDGRRLPLPRIQGGMMPPEQVEVRTRHPAMYNRLVFGPGAGAGANEPLPPPRQPMGPGAPVMRFRDATATVGPEMVDTIPMLPPDSYASAPEGRLGPPNATEELTPAHMDTRRDWAFTGRYLGGDRGLRSSWAEVPQPPQSAFRDIEPRRNTDDAEWNAALARVRSVMEMEALNRPTNKRTTPSMLEAWSSNRFPSAPNFSQREAPIDMSRPRLNNADGSFSTERTITIEADGRHYNIPTIVAGRQRSEDEAIRLWENGQNPEVGVFPSRQEAERAARQRSSRIGLVRGR